jgi:multisubunit Na+/H+ antiporter MnhB subunit
MTGHCRDTEAVPRSRLLPAADHQDRHERSLLLEVLVRLVHPSILVVSVYLLVVGLHHPGGGFAAGLVAGLGLVLRRLAGGPHELEAAAPWPPGVILGMGLTVVAGYAAAGVVLADELLAGAVWAFDAGFLGHVEVPSSLVFETGITLITVGLILDVLRTLGTDQPSDEDAEEAA